MADAIKAITAYQGKLFKVSLGSNFGSTNIGWCLTGLPKGIALLAEENVPKSQNAGAAVDQIFYFSALDEVGTEKLEFRLIKHLPQIGKDEQLETITITVTVVPSNAKTDVSKDRFVEYNENAAVYGSAQDDCTQVLKYGYPPFVKYGYPLGAAAPCPVVQDADGVSRLKYGYPLGAAAPCPVVQDADGVSRLKYGYPLGAAAPCPVVQDADGVSRLKYGYPLGAAAPCPVVQDADGVSRLKYGYPLGAAAPCPVVQDADGVSRLKYGYPVLKYGYPNCLN